MTLFLLVLLLLLDIFVTYLCLLPFIVEVTGARVRFPFVGSERGGLCHSGVWLSCAFTPCVQRLPIRDVEIPPWAPNGCKVVYFGFPLSKYRTLIFALVPIMPTNYLLPLLTQSNQMQLIYTVSLWVFSHNRHAPLWLQGSLFIPLELCMFRERNGELKGGSQSFHHKGPLLLFPLANPAF